MEKIRLGRTELMVTKTAFGALPIQRISGEDAAKLVRRAYESGINFFDTANMYTDSEAKLGMALPDVRTRRRLWPISRRACVDCRRTISTCSSSTIRRSCRTLRIRRGPLPLRWK